MKRPNRKKEPNYGGGCQGVIAANWEKNRRRGEKGAGKSKSIVWGLSQEAGGYRCTPIEGISILWKKPS